MEYGTKLIINNLVKFTGTIVVYDLIANRGEVIIKPAAEGIKSTSKKIGKIKDQILFNHGKGAIKVEKD